MISKKLLTNKTNMSILAEIPAVLALNARKKFKDHLFIVGTHLPCSEPFKAMFAMCGARTRFVWRFFFVDYKDHTLGSIWSKIQGANGENSAAKCNGLSL